MKFKNLIYHTGLLVFVVFILLIFFHDTAVALTDAQKASLVSFGSDLQLNNGITEADPVFTASPANGITSDNITAWNNKQAALGYTAANAAIQINGHALTANANVTLSDLGIGNVENTKISTWAGSSNVTTLGTISNGIWQGTAIGDAYISSASNWNSAWSGYNANGANWNSAWSAVNTNSAHWNSTYADWNANKANWNNFSSANKVTFNTGGATTVTYSLTSGNAPLCNTSVSANNAACWKATGSLGHCNGNNTGSGTCNCI